MPAEVASAAVVAAAIMEDFHSKIHLLPVAASEEGRVMQILPDFERVYPTTQAIVAMLSSNNPLIFDRRPHQTGRRSI